MRAGERAYRELRADIVSWRLTPGQVLGEVDLSERLGISRTPVREALQRLETQSMLKRDGRSLIVATLDHNQLAELYTVRTELEALAARADAVLAAYGDRSDFNIETVNLMREMRRAANSFASLARSIERNPQAFILGR